MVILLPWKCQYGGLSVIYTGTGLNRNVHDHTIDFALSSVNCPLGGGLGKSLLRTP